MHWIEKFRAKNKLSQEEMAKKVRTCKAYQIVEKPGCRTKYEKYQVACSDLLIEILEHGGITAPGIAAAITTVCGGTAEQWDSIVHEDYRGTWKPGDRIAFKPRMQAEPFDVMPKIEATIKERPRAERPRAEKPRAEKPKAEKPKAAPKPQKPAEPEIKRPVVQIGKDFAEAARYATPAAAAAAMNVSLRIITVRCDRKVSDETDEFIRYQNTWRYADEWDSMTPEQRMEDMKNARKRERRSRHENLHEAIPEAGHADQPVGRPR